MEDESKIKKICFVYPGFPPESFGGGISTAIGEIINCFKGKKEKIIVIARSLENNKITVDKIESNIEVHKIPFEPNKLIKILNLITKDYFKMLLYSIYVAKYIKNQNKIEKIDIIESADWGAEIFISTKKPFRLEIPYIIRIYTPGIVSETFNKSNKSYLGNLAKKMEKSVLNNNRNIIITPTNKIIRLLEKNGIKKRKYYYSFINPVDTSKIKKYKKRTKTKFMFAARFEERKGIECIFKAVREVVDRGYSNFELFLYGADTLKDDMSVKDIMIEKYNLRNKINKNIFIKGEVKREQLLQEMVNYNVYVSASTFELVGFSATEAILSGNVLVCTKVGALSQVLRYGKEAIFFEPNNYIELANIMEQIINSEYNLEEISERAQKRFKKYSDYNNNYERMMKLFNKLKKE